jgi:N-acetylglucosaminyldiphosphoundecaprenol N-acetyl-beta-D-mannosaminyltransferase
LAVSPKARAVDPTEATAFPTSDVLGVRIDAATRDDAVDRIAGWAQERASRVVCAACVNNVMEAHDRAEYRAVMDGADLVLPDGRPLVWALRALGVTDPSQVRGTDLMLGLLAKAAASDIPVAFYGGSPKVLERLLGHAHSEWPTLRIAFHDSPPFRPPTSEENEQTIREMNASGARIVFVALGCPKQEEWMASHQGRVQAVLVGVGAAFDFLAGTKAQAPRFLQRAGLEWLFRFAAEPRRLWRRYLRHNPRFMALLAAQVLRALKSDDRTRGAKTT